MISGYDNTDDGHIASRNKKYSKLDGIKRTEYETVRSCKMPSKLPKVLR